MGSTLFNILQLGSNNENGKNQQNVELFVTSYKV